MNTAAAIAAQAKGEAWHSQSAEEVLAQLGSAATGLSAQEAAQRLAADGPKELKEGKRISPFQTCVGQFESLIIWILIAAGVISGVLAAGFKAGGQRSVGARSDVKTVLEVGLLSNMRLYVIVAASFALQLFIHHNGALEDFFGTQPISLGQCVGWIILGPLPLVVLELRKIVRRGGARAIPGDAVMVGEST